MSSAPRLLIGAPASGGGKTTFTCGLLHLLIRRGLRACACKCGPDYIDPMFHSKVIGAPARNLDLFFSSTEQVRALVADSASWGDVVIIEGVMGYYDGVAVSDVASAWDVACVTETPAVLVIDGRGRARSIAAEVKGFASFRENSQVKGVVLNRVSSMAYPRLKSLVEEEAGVAVLGYLPSLEDCSLESRHLGLVTASEVSNLRQKLDKLADELEKSVDVEALVKLAQSAPDLPHHSLWNVPSAPASGVRIAVARDDAFCFHYSDALRMLEEYGAELDFFSPMQDGGIPRGASGLYLAGGYPELHARELSQNASMLRSVRMAIEGGMPTIAECGGFMYLHEVLEGSDGKTYPQVGIVEGTSFRTPSLARFGYVTITARRDGLIADAGDALAAHEFHYWDSTNPGDAFDAQKPQSARSWQCCISTPTLHAGYPHLYLPAHPKATQKFITACADYAVMHNVGRNE